MLNVVLWGHRTTPLLDPPLLTFITSPCLVTNEVVAHLLFAPLRVEGELHLLHHAAYVRVETRPVVARVRVGNVGRVHGHVLRQLLGGLGTALEEESSFNLLISIYFYHVKVGLLHNTV